MGRRNTNSKNILKKKLPGLPQRIAEVFCLEIVISSISAALFYFKLLPQKISLITIVALICMIISLTYTFICLKDYLTTVKRKKAYFRVNIVAWGLFTLVNLVMAHFNTEPVYTWLFFHYKLPNLLARHYGTIIPKTASAAIMSLPMLICILVVWKIKKQLKIVIK